MARLTGILPAFFLSVLALQAIGCEAGGVGDPCIPEDEYYQSFSGYSIKETNVESRSFQCETRVCLVNHFQGRVSCPYGQLQEDIRNLPGDDPRRCKIPGTTGTREHDAVTVAVSPQMVTRQPDKAVYCSCRCANAKGRTDDGAKYCKCPGGFECTPLIDDLKLGSKQLAGSYCIKAGTKYDEAEPQIPCNRGAQDCGPEQPY